MTSVPAAASYREDILETLTDRFLSRLDQSLEEGCEPEISKAAFTKLRDEFKTTFSYYLSTAFDVVFRNELSNPNSKPEEVFEDESPHNLSVTNDDLQNLDDSVLNVCRQRKLYPGKCVLLLEKALQFQTEAAEKVRANIKSVPILSDDNLPTISDDNSTEDILSKLQTEVRETIEKARRVETAANILIDARETFKKIEEN